MTATIETRVRELVSAIVRRVEADVEDAFERAIADELAKRQNGDAHPSVDVEPDDDVVASESGGHPRPPARKVCSRCGETKPLDEFAIDKRQADGRRSYCRACRNARDRERAQPGRVDDDPVPAAARNPMNLLSREEVVDGEARRELLAELRANGVEHELRDGRTFTVLRLPSLAPDVVALTARVKPRRARGFAIA